MPTILAATQRFDVDVVVFDKDGTLVDFDRLWVPRLTRWLKALEAMTSLPVAGDLARALGFDAHHATFVPDGPMAVASTNDIYALAAGVLFRHGYDWHEAHPLVISAAADSLAAPPFPDEIAPRGDVAAALRRLRRAGLHIAVATNDERGLTQAMLHEMGLADQVALMVCGDDPIPPKPDPAGLRWLAQELGTTPARLAMVGDSTSDMLAGRQAGAACIGILGGAGKREKLARAADVLLAEVAEIGIEER